MSVLGLGLTSTGPVIVGAGFWIRTLARAADTVYGFAMGLVGGFIAGITLVILEAPSIADPGVASRIGRGNPIALIAAFIGNLLYHTVCEGLYGASVGKLVCGLRVLSEDLTPCPLKPAFIRSLAYYVDGLFFGVIGYMAMSKSVLQQRHGDHWAKTIVVQKSQVPEGAKRSGLRLLLALVLGSGALVLPLAAGLVWIGLRG